MREGDLQNGADALTTALRSLAPNGVDVGARVISDRDVDGLFPREADLVGGAVQIRRREFATGRTLLRELLGQRCEILADAGRRPALPNGVVGSLAHDRTFAVGAVSRRSDVAALGIDIEPCDALSDDMARIILRADETGVDAHLAFTLKEATYKAWSVLGGSMLDHHDVRLEVDAHEFSAVVQTTGSTFCGQYSVVRGRWVALVVVAAVPSTSPIADRSVTSS